jgi:hypothetical protein
MKTISSSRQCKNKQLAKSDLQAVEFADLCFRPTTQTSVYFFLLLTDQDSEAQKCSVTWLESFLS